MVRLFEFQLAQSPSFRPWATVRNVILTSDVRIRSRLQRPQSVADDKNAGTEPAKTSVNDRWNGEQSPDPIQKQAPDENGSIAIVPQNPGRMTE